MHLSDIGHTFIVSVGNCAESLLPSSIPNLQLNVFAIAAHCLESEIHPNSCHIVLVKLVVGEPKQEAALPH